MALPAWVAVTLQEPDVAAAVTAPEVLLMVQAPVAEKVNVAKPEVDVAEQIPVPLTASVLGQNRLTV